MINSQAHRTQDERRQLDYRGKRIAREICTVCVVFFLSLCIQHVFVESNTNKNLIYVHKNRCSMLDGVKVSDSQGKDVSQRRIYYLTFGIPEVGENGGNTVRNTHQVLKILSQAMRESAFHQDGGWTQAIRVSQYVYFLHVYIDIYCLGILTHPPSLPSALAL